MMHRLPATILEINENSFNSKKLKILLLRVMSLEKCKKIRISAVFLLKSTRMAMEVSKLAKLHRPEFSWCKMCNG